MTWGKFIKLREWAVKTSIKIGYPIYLVGSTLLKDTPRDFDVVITIPEKEFEERFGVLNKDNYGEILVKSFNDYIKEYFECIETLGTPGHTPLDFKVYPDNWFVYEDKILLGKPTNKGE